MTGRQGPAVRLVHHYSKLRASVWESRLFWARHLTTENLRLHNLAPGLRPIS